MKLANWNVRKTPIDNVMLAYYAQNYSTCRRGIVNDLDANIISFKIQISISREFFDLNFQLSRWQEEKAIEIALIDQNIWIAWNRIIKPITFVFLWLNCVLIRTNLFYVRCACEMLSTHHQFSTRFPLSIPRAISYQLARM